VPVVACRKIGTPAAESDGDYENYNQVTIDRRQFANSNLRIRRN